MSKKPISLSTAIDRHFGPVEFFRECERIFSTHKPMTWDAWDKIFASAEKHVLSGSLGAKGEFVPRYPDLAFPLLATWRSARQARELKLTPWQWNSQEEYRVLGLAETQAKKEDAQRAQRLPLRRTASE